jgi:hypothetical protein
MDEVAVKYESRHATEKQRMQEQLSIARESIIAEEQRTEELETSLSTFKAKAFQLGVKLRETETSLLSQLEREKECFKRSMEEIKERHQRTLEEMSKSSESSHRVEMSTVVMKHETHVKRIESQHLLSVESIQKRLGSSLELGRKQSSQLDNLTGAMRVEREHRKKIEVELKKLEGELEEERRRKGPTISLELHQKQMKTMEER